MKNNTDYKIKNGTFNNKKITIYGQLLLQNKFVYCATASAKKKQSPTKQSTLQQYYSNTNTLRSFSH